MLLGLKVAIGSIGIVLGSSSVLTGILFANIEGGNIDDHTGIAFGLVCAGIGGTAVLAWKISRSWYAQETKLAILEKRLELLEKNKPEASEHEQHGRHRHH